MKNSMLQVTCLVPHLKVSNVYANKESIAKMIKENKDKAVLVFPELCLTGYTCGDLFFQNALLEEALEATFELAKETEDTNVLVAVALPLAYKNKIYNVAAFLNNGKIVGIVPKEYIPNYAEFYEARWFSSGKDIQSEVLDIKGEKIPFGTDLLFTDTSLGAVVACEICEDLWVIDKPSTRALKNGANIIVNLSASDETILKKDYRRKLVSMQSGCGYCAYLYCSSGMEESSTDLVFSGHCIISNNGRILNECIYPEEEKTISAIIDLEESQYNRLHQSTYLNEDNSYRTIPVSLQPLGEKKDISVDELSSLLLENEYPISPSPFVPQDSKKREERCQEILHIQAQGLATRVKNTGIKKLVIGISGGLDSTLALLVAYEAKKLVPDISILGITMPNSGNTTSLTLQNALDLMKALDIESRTIPIQDTVSMHLKDIGHSLSYNGEGDVAYENAQARMRTYILMDVANMEGGLVVGTGDLSELALGWCTYNGDHMSMYAVNSSVPKTLVKYLVETYATTMASEELKKTLLSIVGTPISPELTPSKDGKILQKTEEKIGKYDLNDFFLFYFLRYGYSPEKILTLAMVAYKNQSKQTLKENLARFYKRFFSQQFKRSCLPDGPKVGSVTLSPRGDYRMPSDSDVKMFLERLEKC